MTYQLKAFSQLLDEEIEISEPTVDLDRVLELGDFMATGRPGLIVYVAGDRLPKWGDSDD